MNRSLLSLAAFACFALPASADVLYQFSTGDSNPTNDDGYIGSFTTFSLGPGIIAPDDGDELATGAVGLSRFWNSEWAGFSSSSANGNTLDSATEFDTGYFTFTISASPGQLLSLSSLTFDSAEGGSTGNRGFNLYAAVNGGGFSFADTPLLSIVDETGTRAAPVFRSVDLSGAAFQGIDSVTFRYYPLTPATGNTVDFRNVTLNGAVVPEPSAAVAIFAGLACLTGIRRRHS